MKALGSVKGGQKEGDWVIDDKSVVVNKLNEGVLKTWESQGKALGKIGSGGEENKESVGNEVDDKYKQERQPLILVSNLCKRKSWVDKC